MAHSRLAHESRNRASRSAQRCGADGAGASSLASRRIGPDLSLSGTAAETDARLGGVSLGHCLYACVDLGRDCRDRQVVDNKGIKNAAVIFSVGLIHKFPIVNNSVSQGRLRQGSESVEIGARTGLLDN